MTVFSIEEQPCEGTYTVQLLAEPRRGQTAREALLAVRVARVQIQRPDNLNSQDYASSIFLYAVEAKEVNPPPGPTVYTQVECKLEKRKNH